MATTADTAAQVTERVTNKMIDKAGDFVDAAASAAGNVFEAASNILTTAVDKYGQTVVDAVLWVVRVDAIQILVTWWLTVLFALGVIYFMWTGFTRRNWQQRISDCGGEVILHFPVVAATVACVVVLSHGFYQVTNVWTYTAVFKPELYLAKQAVDVVKAKLNPPDAKPCSK